MERNERRADERVKERAKDKYLDVASILVRNNAKLENQYACAECPIENGVHGFSIHGRPVIAVAAQCLGHQLPMTRHLLCFFNRSRDFPRRLLFAGALMRSDSKLYFSRLFFHSPEINCSELMRHETAPTSYSHSRRLCFLSFSFMGHLD